MTWSDYVKEDVDYIDDLRTKIRLQQESLAKHIRFFREDELKCSQREVARRLKCSHVYVGEVERGTRKPSLTWLMKLLALAEAT